MNTRSPGPIHATTVESTFLSNGYIVSTVILLQELAFIDNFVSLLASTLGDTERADLSTPGNYETMVFAAENGEVTNWTELDFRRYDTEEEARAGHEEVVEIWLNKEA